MGTHIAQIHGVRGRWALVLLSFGAVRLGRREVISHELIGLHRRRTERPTIAIGRLVGVWSADPAAARTRLMAAGVDPSRALSCLPVAGSGRDRVWVGA